MDFIKEENRIYLKNEQNEIIAQITFNEIKDGIYDINHTFVDESLRGKGIAKLLVEEAIQEIKMKKGKIVASCSYAKKYLEKNNIK